VNSRPSGARRSRRLAASVLTVVAATAAVAGSAQPAAAHVVLDNAVPNGDGTTSLVFAFDHGCEELATTVLEVTTPEGVTVHSATSSQTGWESTAGDSTVTWQGPAIPSGEKAQFTVVASLTGQPGQSLAFPSIQRCEGGATSEWVDPEGSENPAPVLIATAAVLQPPEPPASSGGSAGTGQILIGIAGLVVLGGAVGATRGRRSPGRQVPQG
jgi:uncharacterized protein YcnI